MGFRRGKEEGLMRNRKQTTFRNEQALPKDKTNVIPYSISEREAQTSFLT